MRGQFIIVNKASGEILMSGQGVYGWESGAQKGLNYWIPKAKREQYVILPLRPELLVHLMGAKPLKHYKGGVYDTVLDATHSETLEPMTVYQSREDNKMWVRPVTMFSESVEVQGFTQPRFDYHPNLV